MSIPSPMARGARYAALCALTACFGTVAIPSQENPKPDASSAPGKIADKKYTSTDALVGAAVTLSPSLEARQDAAREGEQAEGPKAEAIDWLIDCRDGSVDYAVVSVGGFIGIGDKTVLVPAQQLR